MGGRGWEACVCKALKNTFQKIAYLLAVDIMYLWIEGAAQKASIILGSSHSTSSR